MCKQKVYDVLFGRMFSGSSSFGIFILHGEFFILPIKSSYYSSGNSKCRLKVRAFNFGPLFSSYQEAKIYRQALRDFALQHQTLQNALNHEGVFKHTPAKETLFFPRIKDGIED